jgi:hypothetical protein
MTELQGHDSDVRTVEVMGAWAGQLEQFSRYRTAGKGQPRKDKRVGTGHLGLDIWEQTTGTGQPRQFRQDQSDL